MRQRSAGNNLVCAATLADLANLLAWYNCCLRVPLLGRQIQPARMTCASLSRKISHSYSGSDAQQYSVGSMYRRYRYLALTRMMSLSHPILKEASLLLQSRLGSAKEAQGSCYDADPTARGATQAIIHLPRILTRIQKLNAS